MERKVKEGNWEILPDKVRIRYEVDPFGHWKELGAWAEKHAELEALHETLVKLGYQKGVVEASKGKFVDSGSRLPDDYVDTGKPYQLKYSGKGANYKLDYIESWDSSPRDPIPPEDLQEWTEEFVKWVESHLVSDASSKVSNRGKSPNSRKNLSKSSKRKGKI